MIPEPNAPDAATGRNIKPTRQENVVLEHQREFITSTARWWFVPHWNKGDVKGWKAATFNPKIETAREKPTFRMAWSAGRCLSPAIGYHEYTGPKGRKQPWFIRPDINAELFSSLDSVRAFKADCAPA